MDGNVEKALLTGAVSAVQAQVMQNIETYVQANNVDNTKLVTLPLDEGDVIFGFTDTVNSVAEQYGVSSHRLLLMLAMGNPVLAAMVVQLGKALGAEE